MPKEIRFKKSTVGEVMEALRNLPQDAGLYLSSDEEGNSKMSLLCLETGKGFGVFFPHQGKHLDDSECTGCEKKFMPHELTDCASKMCHIRSTFCKKCLTLKTEDGICNSCTHTVCHGCRKNIKRKDAKLCKNRECFSNFYHYCTECFNNFEKGKCWKCNPGLSCSECKKMSSPGKMTSCSKGACKNKYCEKCVKMSLIDGHCKNCQ